MSKKKLIKNNFDEQFEAFLKDSLSSEDSINSAKINQYLDAASTKSTNKPWWDNEDESGGGRKSFLKQKSVENIPPRRPDPNKMVQSTKDPPKPKMRLKRPDSSLSKDSLDDISEKSEEDQFVSRPKVHIPNESLTSTDMTNDSQNVEESPTRPGMDTMDELAEKERFFRDLEHNADGTIDYGRLNQELSATGYTTMSPEGAAKTAATLAALQDINDEEESPYMQPNKHGDYLLSEREQSEQKQSMLSKVSLMDSLESTMNTTTSPHVGKGTLREARDMLEEGNEEEYEDDINLRPGQSIPETLYTNTGLVGTNTSQEIEALQKALEKVGLSTTIGNDSQLGLSSQGDRETEELVKKLLNTDSGIERQRRLDESDVRGGMLEQEARGFALSPAQPFDPDYSQSTSHRGDSQRGDNSSHRGGFDDSHTEETEVYQPITQVSVTERGRGKKKDKKKPDRAKSEGQEAKTKSVKKHKDTLQSPRSTSPLKIDFTDTLNKKYRTVKSSGYGKSSPSKPPRDRSKDKDRDILGYSRTKPGTLQTLDGDGTRDALPRKPQANDWSPTRREQKAPSDTTSLWSPAEVTKQKVKGNQSAKQAKLGTVATSQLHASVESFAQYIKDHFSSKAGNVPQMKYSQDEPFLAASFKDKTDDHLPTVFVDIKEKDEVIEKFRGELEAAESRFHRHLEAQKLEYEQEIAKMKQENFVLAAKVSGDADQIVMEKVMAGGKLTSLTENELASLQKELKEQETLIAGYQQENRRLYDEMKNITKQTKITEEKMFRENQKLLAEASNLRKKEIVHSNLVIEVEKKEDEIRNKGLITGVAAQQMIAAGNNEGLISNLESQLLQSKRTTDAVSKEMMTLQQSRVELEKHVEKLVIERVEMNKQLQQSKIMKLEEAQALEAKYETELDKLKNKLKWYAENQEFLDKSAKHLKNKEDIIHKLKLRIEELQTESGKRVEDSKVRGRERAADAKKIQDLQRQVKEMEQILKRRNPNSLPSLMIAAAAAPDNNTPNNNRTAYTELLEKRVNKLEAELDQKDIEVEKLLRGVEQKYHAIKIQFEDRIKDLETQLSIYQGQADHIHPHTHAVALERELESVRERYKQQQKYLNAEIDRLTSELAKTKRAEDANMKLENQLKKEADADLKALVKSLQNEIENKSHDLQVMQKSLERLRKEKQTSFQLDHHMKAKLKGKNSKIDSLERNIEEPASLPIHTCHEKEYEPKLFEDSHISDVIKENEEMKTKIDRLQLQLDQQRVDYRKSLAENESFLLQVREDFSVKLESVRNTHQQEVKKILAQQALDHSTSRMAELQGKLDTQEVMIKHLRVQQARLEVEAETASVLRIKQTRLEETIKTLQKDLKEAKKSHTPEMRHFESLQDKIVHIENKHTLREQELEQIIRNHKQNASIEIEKEVNSWKKMVEAKNNEIQKFRMELDSILEVLQVLQKQGVIIPVS